MKAIQIFALPETDRFNPSIFALGENGRIYNMTILGALAGESWKALPELPDTPITEA